MKTIYKVGLAIALVCLILYVVFVMLPTEVRLFQDSSSHSVKGEYYKGPFKYETEMLYKTERYSDANASWKSGVTQAFPKWLSRGDGVYYKRGKDVFFVQILGLALGRLDVRISSPDSPPRNQTVTSPMIPLPNGDGVRWSSRDRESIFLYADDYLYRPYADLYAISNPFADFQPFEFSPHAIEALHFSRLPWEQGD